MLYQKRNIHRPLHIYQDNAFYFITARTIKKNKFFNTDEKKKTLLQALEDVLKKYNYKIYAWVILNNHYHLLIKIKDSKDLKFFIKDLHSLSSKKLNKSENQKGRKIWFQYWDWCIRDEKDFYQHFNYIHHNPVKHKYIGSQQKCCEYKFCSYKQWADKKGEKWLDSCFETYPIVDFTVEGDV